MFSHCSISKQWWVVENAVPHQTYRECLLMPLVIKSPWDLHVIWLSSECQSLYTVDSLVKAPLDYSHPSLCHYLLRLKATSDLACLQSLMRYFLPFQMITDLRKQNQHSSCKSATGLIQGWGSEQYKLLVSFAQASRTFMIVTLQMGKLKVQKWKLHANKEKDTGQRSMPSKFNLQHFLKITEKSSAVMNFPTESNRIYFQLGQMSKLRKSS